MSPPEPKPLDSFGNSTASANKPNKVRSLRELCNVEKDSSGNNAKGFPSPPDSPWRKLGNGIVQDQENKAQADPKIASKDPVLYPNDGDYSIQGPLFDQLNEEDERSKLVEEYMRCHSVIPKSKGTQTRRFQMPTKDEYMLVASCIPKTNDYLRQDASACLKRNRKEADEHYRLTKRPRLGSKGKCFPNIGQKVQEQAKEQANTGKKAIPRAPRPSARKSATHATVPRLRPEGAPFKRASPAKKAEPQSVDFNQIPDFSPSLADLPNHSKALSVEWNGHAMDLSGDPNRHMLHEAEAYLASRLRLNCALYLCVKRRIFVGRVNNFVKGKKFTKTDAQACGHIDVNKSSRIWMAYDKVGWFDRKYFEKYIDEVRESTSCYDPALQAVVDTAKFFG